MSNQENCECCACTPLACACECCCGSNQQFNMADYMMIVWGAK